MFNKDELLDIHVALLQRYMELKEFSNPMNEIEVILNKNRALTREKLRALMDKVLLLITNDRWL